MDNLRAVLDYTLVQTKDICGSDAPELFLAGSSARASTSAAIVSQYSKMSKMLLIAPSIDIDLALVKKGLSKFTGELYLLLRIKRKWLCLSPAPHSHFFKQNALNQISISIVRF